jgi:hypothetical protein
MRFASHSLRRLYQSLRGRSVLFRAAGPAAAGADIEATSRSAGAAADDERKKHRPTYRECCLCRISRERRHMLSITASIPADPNRIRYVCGDCIRALSRRWEERQPGAAN